MGAFRGHVNLRPRRPLAGRIARWQTAREAARDAIHPPRPMLTTSAAAGRRPALVSVASDLVRPASRP